MLSLRASKGNEELFNHENQQNSEYEFIDFKYDIEMENDSACLLDWQKKKENHT